MENNQLLLSLCIPTNGIVEWVVPAIESIYAQGVDNSLFEVVVTDNGEKSDLEEAVKAFDYDNFHYARTTSKGFTNQIDAFERCSGEFCKMLNHRSKMMPGSIEAILEIVRKYKDKKPVLYFAEGHAQGGDFIECANTDEFIQSLGVWVSWSCGTGVWKEDLKDIRSKKVDSLFSHTVFLFDLRPESEYVIWNGKYEIQASDKGKGGYDLFYAFSVRILDLISELRRADRVCNNTFNELKRKLHTFLSEMYYYHVVKKSEYTFTIKCIRESMGIYFGDLYYYTMKFKAWWLVPKSFLILMVKVILKALKTK